MAIEAFLEKTWTAASMSALTNTYGGAVVHI